MPCERLDAVCRVARLRSPLVLALPLGVRQEFYSDLKDAEREGEVQRILGAFKLNPYEQLGMRNEAPVEEVRRQYRKVRRWLSGTRVPAQQNAGARLSTRPESRGCRGSGVPLVLWPHQLRACPYVACRLAPVLPQVSLMVHPDKCKHPRAKDAFEVIGEAHKQLLDEEKRAKLSFLLQHAKGEPRACVPHPRWGRPAFPGVLWRVRHAPPATAWPSRSCGLAAPHARVGRGCAAACQ